MEGHVQELSYTVGGMTCDHCKAAVTEEVGQVGGVTGVEVDLDTKLVLVRGENVSDEEVRAAIREAGYEAA
jgi:copper chaperone